MNSDFRNWSDIRVFLAVCKEGSTLAASRKLGMSQPTVARRIEVLEHELGVTLFERDTRGSTPSEAAKKLFPIAVDMEEVAATLSDAARALSRPRPIRVTAPSHFSDANMKILSAFTAAHPEVEIEFVHNIRFLNLLDGEADVAIRVSRAEPEETLIRRKIGVSHFTIYGSAPYAEKHGLPKSIQELRHHTFVSFQHEHVLSFHHDWLVQNVSPDNIVKVYRDIEQMYSAVMFGQGLGIVHATFADTEPALIRCLENIEDLAIPVTMLVSPEAYRRPEVKAFTKFVAPRLAARHRWDEEDASASNS